MRILKYHRTAAVAALAVAASSLAIASSPLPAEADAGVVPPSRVLDTRSGIGAAAGKLQPGSVLTLQVPAAQQAGATSVVLNLTATDAAGDGYLQAWPCGDAAPSTSVINYTPGRTVANMMVLELPADGICMSASVAVDVIADLSGWFTGDDDFVGGSPDRLLDTRQTGDPLAPTQERRLRVAGTRSVGAGAGFAALNLTVDRPSSDGWLVAYPCGQATDGSSVNFKAGEVVANLTMVALSGGDVCFRANVAVQLVVDAYGWSAGNGDVHVQSPRRLIDTRQPSWGRGPVASGSPIVLRAAGVSGVPNNADAALLTVTVSDTGGEGYLTVWPCDAAYPNASTINTWSNQVRSNVALVKLSETNGEVCIQFTTYNGSPTHLIVDAIGWVDGGPDRAAPPPTTPETPPTSGPLPAVPGAAGPMLFEEHFTDTSMAHFNSRFNVELKDLTFSDGRHGESYQGDHDMNCGAPTTQRTVHNSSMDQVWLCAPGGEAAKGHVMTSAGGSDYSYTIFSPKQSFPGGDGARVCWNVNLTTSAGSRTWWEVTVLPTSMWNANPTFAFSTTDFPGEPKLPAQSLTFDFTGNNVKLWAGTTRFLGQSFWEPGYQQTEFATSDKATRYKNCMEDTPTGLRLIQQRATEVRAWEIPGYSLPSSYVVGFKAENYNSGKDGSANQTWHWDDIEVSGPAGSADAQTVALAAPQPLASDAELAAHPFVQQAGANAPLRSAWICLLAGSVPDRYGRA